MSKNDPSEGGIDPKTSKKEKNEDDDDEDEEEYDDAHGSNVVATLCRKVPKDKENLVIAVVVSSKGDRHVAQACATAHITKLKRRFNEENSSVKKCEIIAGMNQKESKDDTETHDKADGDDDVNDSTNTATGAEDDDDKSKGEQDTGSEETKQYDPDEFMELFYNSKNTSFPLRGCVATEAQARSYLKQNAEALQKLSKHMNMRTTWIIPHQSVQGPETDAISTYYRKATIGDKTAVVVLSAFFLSTQDETQQTQQSKTKPTWLKREKHILVCSIPELKQAAGSSQADDLANYKETFNQVKTFIEHYNNTVVDQGNNKLPKIERIALSYPPALYTNYKKLEAAKNKKKTTTKKTKPNIKPPKAHAKKKTSPTKAVKKPGAKPFPYSHHSSASSGSSSGDGSGEDSDEDDDEVDEESQEGQGYEKGEDAYSVEHDDWIKALLEVLGGLKLDIYLMHDGNSNSPWQAPPDVTELERITLTWKFPDCIDISDISKSGEDEDDEDEDDKKQKIKLDDVPSTLFICDRQAGKRVGNDNSSTTTGGVFGSWVPMHYTALRVVDTDKYSNASEINELIDVIYVKNVKKKKKQ